MISAIPSARRSMRSAMPDRVRPEGQIVPGSVLRMAGDDIVVPVAFPLEERIGNACELVPPNKGDVNRQAGFGEFTVGDQREAVAGPQAPSHPGLRG